MGGAAASLLELEGVEKRYRAGGEEVAALRGVDLAVAPGEFVAIVGRSGSGKSTLLHLAGGIDAPDAGAVRLDGVDLAACSPKERARLRRQEIGFVFQFFHLIPSLSVRENVELPLLLDGHRRTNGAAAEWLERVGLGHRAEHRPAELSGGEMQRAAIARALVARPRILLADEPTGNLDSATGRTVLEVLVGQVEEAGAALVMVTHDADAATLGHRVLTLVDGRVAA